MKQILQILALLMIISCNKLGVTKTEVNAVNKVLEFYGGEIIHSIGFEAKNGHKDDYFELKVSKSKLLNDNQKDLTEHAGNIAYLFYTNLQNEKANYDEIRVAIDLENEESRTYKFPTSNLKEIEALYFEIEKTNSFIKSKDYRSLTAQINPKVQVKENDIKSLFEKIHSTYGNIKQIQFQGFEFAKDKEMGEYILVKEVIVLEKEIVNVYMPYNRKDKSLLGINF